MAREILSSHQLDQTAKFCALCRYDPLLFAERAWQWGEGALEGQDIRVWQAEIMDTIAQHLLNKETRYDPLRISVASGHGIGKSAEMGMISTWAMSCYAGARVVVTANTEGQLRTKTSPEIAQWFRSAVTAPLFDVDTMSIKPYDKGADAWSLDFSPWSEHNTEAFAGLHARKRIVLLMMDEASAISDKIWEVAEGALTDEDTVLIWLAFGNPTQNVGRFRETFRKHRDRWHNVQIDSRTVEGTNKKYLQELVDTYGEDSDLVKVRVRGMFPSASSRQFINTELIDKAYGRHLDEGQYDFAPVVLSCDPAWSGDDHLVIAKRQGLHFEILDRIPKNDNDVFIANKIANYEVLYEADAVFIDLGYGTGIKSVGDTMGREWRLVPFGEAAVVAGYANKRAEMYQAIADWLRAGGAIPEDQVLYDDLNAIQTKPRPDGVIQLLSKEDMKKLLNLPSPDCADALALTFAYPVQKKAVKPMGRPRGQRSVQASKVYQPHGED